MSVYRNPEWSIDKLGNGRTVKQAEIHSDGCVTLQTTRWSKCGGWLPVEHRYEGTDAQRLRRKIRTDWTKEPR